MISFKKIYHSTRRKLAKLWLEINSQLTVIGVTGSYGKTNTVRAISEVLSAKYSVNKTDLNLDTIYNLPITILKTKPWDEILVLEYGIDHLGEMDYHLSLVKPKIAVLTGITPVHVDQDHLGSLENLVSEKKKLIDSVPIDGWAVFNYDDLNSRQIGSSFEGKKFFYGTNPKADVWANNIEITPKETIFTLNDGKEKIKIITPLLGYPAVSTSLVAYLVGKNLGVPKEKILEKLSNLKPLPGRLSFEEGPKETFLVNDCLRANLASTVAGLKSFSEFSGRKIAVLGEMGETGEYSEKVHRQIGNEIAKMKIDFVLGVGPLTKYMIEEAQKKKFSKRKLYWAANVQEAARILEKILQPKDLIYLKASLLRHIERVILLLRGVKVECEKISCHRYAPCDTCPFLNKKVK